MAAIIQRAPLAIVAGSGLDLTAVLDKVHEERQFGSFPGLPLPAVAGHEGRFLIGQCQSRKVVVQCGRLHLYEGWPLQVVQQPVDVLADMGVKTIITTNAAGGLLPEMPPGALLAVRDLFLWPCAAWNDAPDELHTSFIVPGCQFQGRYAWMHGPSYETRAEIQTLQRLGAAAVGMSAGPELARCIERGIHVAAVACITNNCCDAEPLSHNQVLQSARDTSANVVRLLRSFIQSLPSS